MVQQFIPACLSPDEKMYLIFYGHTWALTVIESIYSKERITISMVR